jgi:hypothetical protein
MEGLMSYEMRSGSHPKRNEAIEEYQTKEGATFLLWQLY